MESSESDWILYSFWYNVCRLTDGTSKGRMALFQVRCRRISCCPFQSSVPDKILMHLRYWVNKPFSCKFLGVWDWKHMALFHVYSQQLIQVFCDDDPHVFGHKIFKMHNKNYLILMFELEPYDLHVTHFVFILPLARL